MIWVLQEENNLINKLNWTILFSNYNSQNCNKNNNKRSENINLKL